MSASIFDFDVAVAGLLPIGLECLVQAGLSMNCLGFVTDCPLIQKASGQTEGCSGPIRYLVMVTGWCFCQGIQLGLLCDPTLEPHAARTRTIEL